MNKPLIFLSFAIAIVTSAMGNTSDDAKRAELSAKKSETSDAITEKFNAISDNALTMRTHERTTSNKLLGAGGMGAAGIGGAMVASATSENNADTDAEREMRAYLATFHCNYGTGQNIPGGETDIELPGGNELIGLYSEYVNLANDLKVRKTALGMRPGIESEPILDAATSGLYDDISVGKTSGAYTSLARALMDPNGADAAAWAAQRAETAEKQKSGSTILVAGLAGSLAGNLAMNANAPRDRSAELTNEYNQLWALLQQLEDDINKIQPQPEPCPTGTTGEKQPHCTCIDNKKIFNPKTTKCEDCPGDKVAIDGDCKCPKDKLLSEPDSDKCYAKPQHCTSECNDKLDPNLQVLFDCSCICLNGYTYKNGRCTCDGENQEIGANGKCLTVKRISTQTTTTVKSASLPAGSLFKIKSSVLEKAAETALKTFITGLSDAGYTNCKITIDGYTDPLGGENSNKELSQERANAVMKYINSLENPEIKFVTPVGHGEYDCTCGAGNTDGQINGSQIDYGDIEYNACSGKDKDYPLEGNARYAPCRRVEISADCELITTETQQQ